MDTSLTDKPSQPKLPIIAVDSRLEKYRGKVLFPEKLAKANRILSKSGVPKPAK